MSKDGFVLLVMGYTGPETMRMKKAYITRFNEMEEALRHASAAPVATPAVPWVKSLCPRPSF